MIRRNPQTSYRCTRPHVADEASTTLSVHEAAQLLGRDSHAHYALVGWGDLVGVSGADGCTLRVDRASLESITTTDALE